MFPMYEETIILFLLSYLQKAAWGKKKGSGAKYCGTFAQLKDSIAFSMLAEKELTAQPKLDPANILPCDYLC